MLASGYEKPFGEFKSLLEERFQLMKKYLVEELALHLRSKDKIPYIVDREGFIIELEEVHQMIQGDERLQREFYNIWMSTFR